MKNKNLANMLLRIMWWYSATSTCFLIQPGTTQKV